MASLLAVNGLFYGTTRRGGTSGDGVVFSIGTSGSANVIYSFKGYPYDGAAPYAGLIDVDGTFYGTTEYGGSNATL